MGKKKMHTGSVMIISVAVAILICIGLVAVTAQLIMSGRIGEVGTEIGINTAIIFATTLSGMLGLRLSGEKPELYCILHTITLLLIVTAGGLIIDGAFKNALFRVGSLVVGGGLICTQSINIGKRRKRKNRRYR